MTATLPRITTRVDSDIQNLLSQAAAASGISSINAFVLCAAVEKAKKIIENDQKLKLSKHDAIALVKALDAQPEINARLQQAAQRYESKKQ